MDKATQETEAQAPAQEDAKPAAPAKKETPDMFCAEAAQLAASVDKFVRGLLDRMLKGSEAAELRAHQAAITDLVRRASESGVSRERPFKYPSFLEAMKEVQKAGIPIGDKPAVIDWLVKNRHWGQQPCDVCYDAYVEFEKEAKRARADFLNYQERARKDLARAEEQALRGYVSDLLPILDSLDLSRLHATSEQADLKTVQEALTMLAESLQQTLKVRGLERIQALGQPLDPERHEPVHQRPADETKGEKPGTVVEELRTGYLWKGLLLRPAQVVVTAQRQ